MMRRQSSSIIVLGVILLLLLTACAGKVGPAQVIEDYLKAKVASNADRLAGLSCKAWEANALLDASSFESVDAELRDMACQEDGKNGDYTLVTCRGTIVVAYQGETREFNLSDTVYRAIQEDGEWKMCGQQ